MLQSWLARITRSLRPGLTIRWGGMEEGPGYPDALQGVGRLEEEDRAEGGRRKKRNSLACVRACVRGEEGGKRLPPAPAEQASLMWPPQV